MAAEQERYVTKLELYKTQQDLKNDVTGKIDKVDEKVAYLNSVVLPLVESSKQTAINTDRMATAMDKFTAEQRRTNGKLYEKLNDHDVSLTELGHETKSQTEIKKANIKFIVSVIGLIGIVISGIFGLAPLFFN